MGANAAWTHVEALCATVAHVGVAHMEQNKFNPNLYHLNLLSILNQINLVTLT